MRHISKVYEQVMGRGIEAGRVGARAASGMKELGAAREGAAQQLPLSGGGTAVHGGDENSGKEPSPKARQSTGSNKRIEQAVWLAYRNPTAPAVRPMLTRQTTQTPRAIARRGVVSLVSINGVLV